ncbi:hypothetical protein [Spiroplasma culicicola]|uniref:ABC transporter permease n=1 Tax=Spiroplasma culicicola AES-1 TaxID=1276246 RepID=W6A7B2_9MOLU|nr:hypothetical protein [Spiroplasma culicicola]AHI53033.1 hypothetical protein SCULI_v1c06920 [Spiroplasma culicicola AES-1]
MKKISYSFPIMNRIFLNTFKSKTFIISTVLFFISFLIANIVISTSANSGNHFDSSMIIIYVFNFAILLIYFSILQMWYFAKFKIEDKKSGIFSLELRNNFSAQKIYWQRLIPIFLITTIIFIISNLIMLAIVALSQSVALSSMAANLFLGMFIILFINYLIGAILVLISNISSTLLLGIAGSLMMILLAFNFLWTMLTTIFSNLYDNGLAFNSAQYQIIYKTKELEQKYEDQFEQLITDFSKLKDYKIKDKWAGEAHNGFCSDSTSYSNEFCLKNGVSIFAFDYQNGAENQYLELLSVLNQEFLEGKNIETQTLESIWGKTYFDQNNQKTYNFEGEFNFNNLIKFINTTNNSFLIELSDVINKIVNNIFTLETYWHFSSQNGGNSGIMYLKNDSNTWIEANKDTINPAIRLYEMGLEFLINNRLNPERMYIYNFDEDSSNLTGAQYYKQNMTKLVYLNPFLAFQSVFFYDNLRSDSFIDQKLSYSSKMWIMPIFNLYDVQVKNNANTDYFKTLDQSSLISIAKEKQYFNPIFVYLILVFVIALIIFLSYIAFKKTIYWG